VAFAVWLVQNCGTPFLGVAFLCHCCGVKVILISVVAAWGKDGTFLGSKEGCSAGVRYSIKANGLGWLGNVGVVCNWRCDSINCSIVFIAFWQFSSGILKHELQVSAPFQVFRILTGGHLPRAALRFALGFRSTPLSGW
jgi:hypothetical protein